MNKTLRIIIGVLLIAMTILSIGGCMAMLQTTLVSAWVPFGIGTGVGLLTSIPLWPFWRRLTGIDSFALNWACNVLFIGAVTACLLLFINLKGTGPQTAEHTTATVVEKQQKTRHHTRRVRRRTYATGREYYVYSLTVELDDGRRTSLDVNAENYRRMNAGDKLGVGVVDGALGWDVLQVDRVHIADQTNRPGYTRRYGR